MRKWMLAGLGLLLVLPFGMETYAKDRNDTSEAGTSVIRIQALRGSYKILMVHPWSQNVTVSVYRSGAVSETFDVEAGSYRTAYITTSDSVQIARGTATIVDWSISEENQISPQAGGASSEVALTRGCTWANDTVNAEILTGMCTWYAASAPDYGLVNQYGAFKFCTVTSFSGNSAPMTVTRYLNENIIAVDYFGPGGGFADYIACDSMKIVKTAADTVSYKLCW